MEGGGDDARWGNGRKRQVECFVFKGSRPSHVEGGGWKLCFELYKDWKEAMIRATAFHSRPLLKVKVPLGHKSNLWRQSRGGSNHCVYADVKEDGGNVNANVPSSELPKKSMQTDNWGNLSDSRWRNICSLPLTREENQM